MRGLSGDSESGENPIIPNIGLDNMCGKNIRTNVSLGDYTNNKGGQEG
jgi:hypothetical protein